MTEHRVEDLQRLYVLLARVNALPVLHFGFCVWWSLACRSRAVDERLGSAYNVPLQVFVRRLFVRANALGADAAWMQLGCFLAPL